MADRRVVVVGSIHLDFIAEVEHLPAPGETLQARRMMLAPGGKGANQALAAARMGASVVMIGTVGDDPMAIPALTLLRQQGVDLSHVDISPRLPTGLAWIHRDLNGENAITVVSGANQETGATALEHLEDLLTGNDILLLQCEIPLATVKAAVALAKSRRVKVLLDPAPVIERLGDWMFHVDVLAPNAGEAETLLGQRISNVREAKAAARTLRSRGAPVAVVKLGGGGVTWATSRSVFYEPAAEVNVVDATGAGDCFMGTLAARLLLGDSVSDGIRTANKAAGISTTKAGAQPSFPGAAVLSSLA